MREFNTNKWNNLEQNLALLYFSQLVEELLFYYTIDSFKLPAHNVNTLIAESRKTIEHIKDGILKEGCYDSIKNELINIISKDSIFTNLLKSQTEIIIKTLNGKSLQESDKLLDYIQIQLKDDYRKNIIDTIRKKIIEKDYDDLNRLTKYLLIEMLNYGNSIEFIKVIMTKIFKKSPVNDIASYDTFISNFFTEDRSYKVYFKASNKFLQFKDFFAEDVVEIFESFIPNEDNYHINQFNKISGCVILYKVKAKDPFKAFAKSSYSLENIVSHLMFIQHQSDFSISKNGLINDDNQWFFYNGSNNPILRRPDDFNNEKIRNKLRTIIRCMKSKVFDVNSKKRINLAYFRHLNSLRSISYESQLVDIWSGVEILVPIFTKDSSDKIQQIIESIVPMITSEYFYKITFYLYKSIIRSYSRNKIKKILKDIDGNIYLAFLKILMIKEYESEYEKLILLLDNYPLLQKRIAYYHKKLSDLKEIAKIYNNHQIRVEWQIQRIYRGRNLIVHSGKTPYQLETLIENLHYYFDTVINKINIEISKTMKYITLEHIFLIYKFYDLNYKKNLEKNKNEKIDVDLIKQIINKEF